MISATLVLAAPPAIVSLVAVADDTTYVMLLAGLGLLRFAAHRTEKKEAAFA